LRSKVCITSAKLIIRCRRGLDSAHIQSSFELARRSIAGCHRSPDGHQGGHDVSLHILIADLLGVLRLKPSTRHRQPRSNPFSSSSATFQSRPTS
jgi:hypothetical protein